MTLYHVTKAENVESILAHGLRANAHGEIYAITNKKKKNDLGLTCSALFAMDTKGITGQIIRSGHWYYRGIHQTVIEPKYLTLLWCKAPMRRLLHQQEVVSVGKRLRATVHVQVHHRITVGAVARKFVVVKSERSNHGLEKNKNQRPTTTRSVRT